MLSNFLLISVFEMWPWPPLTGPTDHDIQVDAGKHPKSHRNVSFLCTSGPHQIEFWLFFHSFQSVLSLDCLDGVDANGIVCADTSYIK
jgi:hypothetical protein